MSKLARLRVGASKMVPETLVKGRSGSRGNTDRDFSAGRMFVSRVHKRFLVKIIAV